MDNYRISLHFARENLRALALTHLENGVRSVLTARSDGLFTHPVTRSFGVSGLVACDLLTNGRRMEFWAYRSPRKRSASYRPLSRNTRFQKSSEPKCRGFDKSRQIGRVAAGGGRDQIRFLTSYHLLPRPAARGPCPAYLRATRALSFKLARISMKKDHARQSFLLAFDLSVIDAT